MITRMTKLLLVFVILFLITIPLGCDDGSGQSQINPQQALVDDAREGLKSEINEEYTQMTIIRGALYKYSIDFDNPTYLGIATGALQAIVFPDKYEYERFTKLYNLNPDMKKEIIQQPMLNIVISQRDTLTHMYNEVLKPLADQVGSGKKPTSEQINIINDVIRFLDKMVAEYATLAKPEVDFNGSEAEEAFYQLQNNQNKLQEISLPAAESLEVQSQFFNDDEAHNN